jgi:hypothetical protein
MTALSDQENRELKGTKTSIEPIDRGAKADRGCFVERQDGRAFSAGAPGISRPVDEWWQCSREISVL